MENLTKIKLKLNQLRLDSLLITSIPNITYLTGISHFSNLEREAFLFITEKDAYIITDGRYSEAVERVSGFNLLEITPENPFKKAIVDLARKYKVKELGFEATNLTYLEFKHLRLHLKGVKLIPQEHFIENKRLIKEKHEIQSIEQACAIGDKTFLHILSYLKIGVSEKEVQQEIEHYIKLHAVTISFTPIVAFGPHSSIPHHKTSQNKLKENSIVLLDFGVKLNNYCSDMTRTVFFGKASEKFKKIYNTVLEAQSNSIELLNTKFGIQNTKQKSIKASDVDTVARDQIISQGYTSIPHSVGHGIGLEVHELPHISSKSKHDLQKGMVFSIEPGIYIPKFGGVRIEDLIALMPSGVKILTKSSKELIEI